MDLSTVGSALGSTLRVTSSVLRDVFQIVKLRKELETLKTVNTQLENEKGILLAKVNAIASDPKIAEFAGWYSNEPGLMESISIFLGDYLKSDSILYVAADFAGFGAISWNAKFMKHYDLLTAACVNGRNNAKIVKMVYNSMDANKLVIEKQFTDDYYEENKHTLFEKIKGWSSSSLYIELADKDEDSFGSLSKLKSIVKNGDSSKMKKKLFIDTYLEFNERLIKKYESVGARVFRRDNPVPFHGWFMRNDGNGTQGILGIADFQAIWNEPGFWIRGEIAIKIADLVDLLMSPKG